MRRGRAVTRIEERTNDHDAGHLAVRPRGGLQRNAGQACDLREVFLEFVDYLQRTLCVRVVSQRMKISEARDARYSFVQSRVVLHRTRAERIHAEIDRVVPGRHANEVSNHVDFTDFRHSVEIVIPAKLRRDLEWDFIDIQRGQAISNSSWP